MGYFLSISLLISCVLLVSLTWRLVYWVWWRPMKVERYLKEQGIKGPPYKLLYGNMKDIISFMMKEQSKPMNLSHQIVPRVYPFQYEMMKKYGKMSLTWFGTNPRVNIMDPELIREILSNKFGHFAKLKTNPITELLAKGLANYEGEKWAKHRRIINPAFHQEKLKRMLPAFSTCCSELISRWEQLVVSQGSCELDVWPELQILTGDVISRTAFGSNYKEGRRIFQLQTEQAKLLIEAAQSLYLPGFRFLPTKKNLRRKEIDREVRTLLTGIIKKREKAIKLGDADNGDLLGILMESNLNHCQENGNSKSSGMTTEDVIQECKLFYFAGQETTSVLLAWTMVVLSMHPNWQQQAREEVLQVFGNNKPDFDGLNHLKIVTMILYEVLRLYPPGTLLLRRTYKRMTLGGIDFPPDVQFSLQTLFIHHDPEIWGNDVDEFKPDRFSGGVSNATKNQVAFFPFSWGPRICIGQSFALIEAKLALAMILQHFSFELSAAYAHAPYTVLTLQPQHGVQVMLQKI
ncbi:cytochrome P450 CYP72A616-like isoform X1 [Tasmannia lanceolata]|uniref:cytochrome P450 CYP72A616-like isoform X1 n=2 Tax=Tasmannia lanceolata TaxID=3420 RepID=UPI004062DF5F